MASRRKQAVLNAAELAAITKVRPYIQRLIEDEALRENLRTSFDSGRNVVGRLQGSKHLQRTLLSDKKLHNDLQDAAQALRDAAMALSDAPQHPTPPKRKRRWGRRLLLLIVGAGVALAASESLRSKVLDTLFGAEEEFQYTPPVETPAPPESSPVSAA